MSESERRALIIAEAKTWIGVRFHMNGDSMAGIDCGRFPKQVLEAAGIPVGNLPHHWPRDFMCHKMAEGEPYLTLIQRDLVEVPAPLPGDLAVFKPAHSRCFSHAAIVIDWPRIIHARGVGGHPCVEESTANDWPLGALTPVRFFSPFKGAVI